MAYEKLNLSNGEKLTAEHLAHIEEGIAQSGVEAAQEALAQARDSGEFDGYTPIRGTDYWTEADQESIVQQVIAALGTPVFGRVDEENNIILTGALADGTYTIKYEDAEGNVIDIGTLRMAEPVVNQIPLSINADGTPFVGENGESGYKVGYRLSSSGAESAQSGINVTGFIPVKAGDVICLRGLNVDLTTTGGKTEYSYCALYSSDFTHKRATRFYNMDAESDNYIYGDFQTDADGYLTSFKIIDTYGSMVGSGGYMRISAPGIDGNTIITVNQPIE